MKKTEMALWLAELIGWKRGKDYSIGNEDIVPLIYSPKGFFSVWDKCLSEDLQSPLLEVLYVDEEGNETWQCDLYDFIATGGDRYEAFYNAVYKVILFLR